MINAKRLQRLVKPYIQFFPAPAKKPPSGGAIIAASEVMDWLMPKMLPWICVGALSEILAKLLVQHRDAKQTAG